MAEGSEIEYDPEFGIMVVNESEVSTDDLRSVIADQAPELAVLRRWSMSSQGMRRGKHVFERDKYVSPDNIFDTFKLAADAVRTDDIVSNVVETTEALAFKRIAMECEDEDEQNIWAQIINELNLSERLREGWREIFTVSQAYPAVVYGRKSYKVKGKSPKTGTTRKKTFNNVVVPIGFTYLDPCKVIPVGNFMFNQETLVYLADRAQALRYEETLAGMNTADHVVSSLFLGQYPKSEETQDEYQLIRDLTGVADLEGRLFILNPRNVWRMTSTRPSYRRFADVRMESVFEILDLKHLLREMDRAAILGSTNAIILVKKGTDDKPAKPGEIEQLSAQLKTGSRVPIIVGDHRIEIEIITPDTDNTLSVERHDLLDNRIAARLYQTLKTGGSASSTEDSEKLLKVVSSSMEARRDQIRDSFMDHVFLPTWRENDKFTTEPRMAFYPRRIALNFDPNIAQFMLDSRDRGDISRETTLAEVDIIQEEEFIKRKREAEKYDKVFTPTNVPFDKPGEGTTNPKAAGRAGGGNANGGGRNPASTKANPPKKKPTTKASEDDVMTVTDDLEQS